VLRQLPLPGSAEWPPSLPDQERIRRRIRDDFRAGRYAVVDGWLISHTEAAYLVLLTRIG